MMLKTSENKLFEPLFYDHHTWNQDIICISIYLINTMAKSGSTWTLLTVFFSFFFLELISHFTSKNLV